MVDQTIVQTELRVKVFDNESFDELLEYLG